MSLLRVLQQYLHVLTKLPQILVVGMQHGQFFIEPLGKSQCRGEPFKTSLRSIQKE